MNVTVNVNNTMFELFDENKNILFQHHDWKDIEDYAQSNDLNIMYGPQDLVFDVSIDPNADSYIVVDVKYNQGHDDLGYHNIYGLPSCIDSVEATECTFIVIEDVSEQDVVDEMEKLGAKREFFL